MRPLKNHLILYDAECPMCQLYTKAFTNTGMLDPNGRAPYQNMPEFACPLVDRQRAVNEIALIDKTTGEVRYGIDSLFAVIANSFPILRPLFTCKAFHWTMRKAYAFISYNRKVIIPAPKGDTHIIQPSFKLHYRIAWLLFTTLVIGSTLAAYTKSGHPWHAYVLTAGQVFFQGLLISIIAPAKRWDYLGNMMTISFAGALLLLALKPFIPATGIAYLPILALMLLEHLRRTNLLSLDRTLTISWIFYQLFVIYIVTLTQPTY